MKIASWNVNSLNVRLPHVIAWCEYAEPDVLADYFVDANVCCQGPGLINYHVPVTITDGETEIVDLQACLVCV